MPVEHNRAFAPHVKAMKDAGVDENGKKISGPSPEQFASGLEATSDLARETGHTGKDLRPCIAVLVETPLTKGGFPKRNVAAVVIATELRRIGINYGEVNQRLERWNACNRPPLKLAELQRAVDNVFANDYRYSCRHAVLQDGCIGIEHCPFASRVKSKPNKYNDLKFIDVGWQGILSNRQVLLYSVGLPYLEKTRQVGRGGLVCASHQQLAEACGITRKRLGDDLQTLCSLSLIEYEPGRPRKWEGIASEIRRVFPVPRPTHKHTQILNQLKAGKQSANDSLDSEPTSS